MGRRSPVKLQWPFHGPPCIACFFCYDAIYMCTTDCQTSCPGMLVRHTHNLSYGEWPPHAWEAVTYAWSMF